MSGHHTGKLLALDFKAFRDRGIEPACDGGDDSGNSDRRMPQDAIRQFQRGWQQVTVRYDPVHETHFVSALRRKRIASQKKFERTLATNKTRKALSSSECRRNADTDLWFGKGGLVARHREMYGLGNLATASEGNTIYSCDDRLGKCLHPR